MKKIFYSWQSDLPNNTNRSFIEDCLKNALKKVENFESLNATRDEKYTIDKDTANKAGSPRIVDSIFSKISECEIFLADVSIINQGQWYNILNSKRKSPNPNVLVELGYAIAKKDWDKVILVYNLKYGRVEDLPFDLRGHRVLTYDLSASKNKQIEKDKLVILIKNAIAGIESNGLPKLKLEIRKIFEEINPAIVTNLDKGEKHFSVMMTETHISALKQLSKNPLFEKMLKMESNGNQSSSNTNFLAGSINDLSHGFLYGFSITFQSYHWDN